MPMVGKDQEVKGKGCEREIEESCPSTVRDDKV